MNKSLDKKYFQELFNTYYEELCRIVYPILNDATTAEDVVQDVFVKLWENRSKTIIKTTYKAYLYKACVFRAIDSVRKQNNKLQVIENLKVAPKNESFADEDFKHKELQNAIAESLNKLSDSTKEIFLLSRYSHLKNKEIALYLAISIKTVEANISKALNQLRVDLKPFLIQTILIILLIKELFIN